MSGRLNDQRTAKGRVVRIEVAVGVAKYNDGTARAKNGAGGKHVAQRVRTYGPDKDAITADVDVARGGVYQLNELVVGRVAQAVAIGVADSIGCGRTGRVREKLIYQHIAIGVANKLDSCRIAVTTVGAHDKINFAGAA